MQTGDTVRERYTTRTEQDQDKSGRARNPDLADAAHHAAGMAPHLPASGRLALPRVPGAQGPPAMAPAPSRRWSPGAIFKLPETLLAPRLQSRRSALCDPSFGAAQLCLHLASPRGRSGTGGQARGPRQFGGHAGPLHPSGARWGGRGGSVGPGLSGRERVLTERRLGGPWRPAGWVDSWRRSQGAPWPLP